MLLGAITNYSKIAAKVTTTMLSKCYLNEYVLHLRTCITIVHPHTHTHTHNTFQMEAKIVLARLLSTFQFTLPENYELVPVVKFTQQPRGTVPCTLQLRSMLEL